MNLTQIIGTVIGIAVAVVIFGNVLFAEGSPVQKFMLETSNTTANGSPATAAVLPTVWSILPAAVFLSIAFMIGTSVFGSSQTEDEEEEEEEEEVKPVKRRLRNPKTILAQRLANGTITPQEYTERMARL